MPVPPSRDLNSAYDDALRDLRTDETTPNSNVRPTTRSGRTGFHDPPPHAESSSSRLRRNRLRLALQGTEDLAREAQESTMPRPRINNTIGRRRQRSPSNDEDGPPESAVVRPENPRRPKRRRLATDILATPRSPIKYGHYGQVEPGKIQLQLISCDGGEHTDTRAPGIYLGPLNILRTDKSVYCSDRPNATIILRHADDTPFTLEKLHIVGPEHGFTAPVREGLAYVAMSFEDLQPHIDPPVWARRHGIDDPPYRPDRGERERERERAERERAHRAQIEEDLEDMVDRARRRQTEAEEYQQMLERRRRGIPETMAEQAAMMMESRDIESVREQSEGLTLSDALRDPEVNAAPDRSSFRGSPDVQETGLDLHRAAEYAEGRPERRRRLERDYYGDDFGFGRRSPSQHCDPPNYSTTSPSSSDPSTHDQPTYNHLDRPSITVTSSGRSIGYNPREHAANRERLASPPPSDEDDRVEEHSSQEILDYRLQRLRQMRRHFNFNTDNDPASPRWALGGLTFDVQGNPVRSANDDEAPPTWTPWRRRTTYGHGRPTQARMDRLDSLMARSRIRSEVDTNEREEDWLRSPPPPDLEPTDPEPTTNTAPFPNRYWEDTFGNAPASRAANVGLHPFVPTTGRNKKPTSLSTAGYGGRENIGDDKVTCARFSIEKGKHRVAIRFEPALSARFVMLKLWAGSGRGNVDVQSVVAMGFGGGRIFVSKGVV